MHLVERLWTAAVSFVSIFSFSAIPDSFDNHASLQLPLVASPISPGAELSNADYPIFFPPGGSNKTGAEDFRCHYPSMTDWEDCSHEPGRGCWLRHKNGTEFNISTDYENYAPFGIDRVINLNITDSWFAADGKNFDAAKLFNNTYPGPWIQACWGDRLIITVTNKMKYNGTSVHWHGIRQLKTAHMDGVNGVTQCPIAPHDTFVYNFTLQQYGSSWYHSHYSVQYADGAAGPMTIHGPSSSHFDEAISPPLIMTDWFHNSAFYVLTGGDRGGKDILLNGRGNITRFDNHAPNKTEIKPLRNITFEKPPPGMPGKKYLMRVINTSFDTTFVFSIDNHLLTVVSADFVPIHPYQNTSILVGIGQRYNVIVQANPIGGMSPEGNYWIRTQIANCFGGSTEGNPGYDEVAILRYDASSKTNPNTTRWGSISLECSDENYESLVPILPWTVGEPKNGAVTNVGPHFGQRYDVYFPNSNTLDCDGKSCYPEANSIMDTPRNTTPIRVDYSEPTFLHLNSTGWENWPKMWRVEPEQYSHNSWIYLVINGYKVKGTKAHPVENRAWDPEWMNLKKDNPPRRDVVLLPNNGYVVIAFKADNPGPWLVHCHIAFHISFGLGMQIMEDRKGAFAIWPDNDSAVLEAKRVCENWNTWHSNQTNWWNQPKSIGGDCIDDDVDYCFQEDSGV